MVYPLYRLYSKCIFKYKSMKINQRLTLCFSLLFCLLSISYASAQQLNISGVVISSEDNEPLIGATVSVKGNPTKGVITDINGQFQLSVETGTKMLVVSYEDTGNTRPPQRERTQNSTDPRNDGY